MADNLKAILCIPKSLWCWDFDLYMDGHSASIEFEPHPRSEQGAIVFDNELYSIQKHGPFSGRWSMESSSEVVATAHKPSMFSGSFDLATCCGFASMRAKSVFGRTMIASGLGLDVVIAPVNCWTTRTLITGQISDFRIACFSFWLTVLLWRRLAQSDGG